MITTARRSASVAAALSFIVPGLGQAWIGAVRRGAVIALPTVLAFLVLAYVVATSPNLGYVAGLLIQPQVLLLLLIVNVGFLVYRIAAVVDAYRIAARRWGGWPNPARGPSTAFVGILVVLAIVLHGLFAWVDYNAYDLVSGLFGADAATTTGPDWGDDGPIGAVDQGAGGAVVGDPIAGGSSGAASPSPAVAATAGGSTAGASPSPSVPGVPYWAQDGRLNVLIVGGDAGPGRFSLRTDTMILLSVEVTTGRAALFGIPRNLTNVPVPPAVAKYFPGGVYGDLLNAYYRYASSHPKIFPGGDTSRGYRALSDLIGNLAGVSIDGMVVADLNGFVRVIDALGGLKIDVPYPIRDNFYPKEDGTGTIQLRIPAGPQVLSGSLTLAFARTRHMDSDYGRMSRQQLVLIALRKQLTPCAMLPRLPEFVTIAKESLWTNVPVNQLPSLLALADRVDTKRIARFAFTPPKVAEFVTAADVTTIRKMVSDAFKGAPPPPEPDSDGSIFTC